MPTVSRPDMISTVTDTTNIKYNISSVIDQLSPTDVPLLTRIGRDSLKFPCDQVKHEWLEDELNPRETTLDGAYTAGSGTLTVASGAGKYFMVDDILMIGNNILRIINGPPDSDTFIVTGGLGSTTDANASNGATVKRIGHAAQEGGVARMDSPKTDLVRPYNYTQILKKWTVVTGTMEVIKRYGYASERAYQEAKKMKELAIDLELLLLYGARSYAAGPPRKSTMGGLAHYILYPGISGNWDTVYDANGAEITETMLNDRLQAIWEEGGRPDLMLVNGYNKRVITKWATPRIRTDRNERMAGASVGYYESDFGTLEIVLDRWLTAGHVPLLDSSQIGIGPLQGRSFSSRKLPQLGDYVQTEILGEYTMEVHKGAQAHGWIYNTATSG